MLVIPESGFELLLLTFCVLLEAKPDVVPKMLLPDELLLNEELLDEWLLDEWLLDELPLLPQPIAKPAVNGLVKEVLPIVSCAWKPVKPP